MTTAPQDRSASPGGVIRFATGAAIAAIVLTSTFRPEINMASFLLGRQDVWLLLTGMLLIALACWRLPQRSRLPEVHWRTWLLVAAALIVVTFVGHYLVLCGYDLSRDEQMASFDAAVFQSGHLVAPLPARWRDHADVLNTLFMYPAVHRSAWISAYLPVNAALRGLIGLIATPWLTGPLLTALGAVALFGCVRRLWPQDREAGFVALLLYAGSAQVLFTGMTSYAMTGHLALDLCWLWLFLRGTRAADLAALAVGFAATGLHQPVMHPMFVAPFILMLCAQRRWSRATIYVAGYAAIGLFWLWWPNWTWSLVQFGPDPVRPAGVDFATRLIENIRDSDPRGLANMVANMLRFIAWQHLLLVPLMIIGMRRCRTDPMIAALAGGLVLTTLVMAIVMSHQGNGFGYRYLHGLLGNAILLAIYGWQALGDRVAQWRTLLLRTTVAGLLVLFPMQAWMAHRQYSSAALVSDHVNRIDADFVAIGRKDLPFSTDLAINPPHLDRRPVRLLRDELSPVNIAAVCAGHPSIALIGDHGLAPYAAYYGFGPGAADVLNPTIAPLLANAGCLIRQDR
jgi:hypothetical protein